MMILSSRRVLPAAVVALTFTCAGAAFGQTSCNHAGPDLVIGDVASGGIANYNVSGGIDAVAVGQTMCNVGNSPVTTMAITNRHPVITTNVYRLSTVDGSMRFEQIGMGWVFHTIFSLSNNYCCTTCTPTDGSQLGIGCSSTDSAAIMGSTPSLGPRYQIDASTGAFPFPPANPPVSGANARRCQITSNDVDPALHPGATYFVELQGVAPDDSSSGNNRNNISYRPVTVASVGGLAGWNFLLAGPSVPQSAALSAWRVADPGVRLSIIDVPSDGRMILGSRATQLPTGLWRYEYALLNINSNRSAAGFSIPLPAGASVVNAQFHDVEYHDGDGLGNINFDGTDWSLSAVPGSHLSWSTDAFNVNPSANALRWGTLYNFRFDSASAPTDGDATISLFRPGASPTITAMTIPVPAGGTIPDCRGDFNNDGDVTSQDFFDFIEAFFTQSPTADFNDDGHITSQDFFDFIGAFFIGC